MDAQDRAREHYSRDGLEDVVLGALRSAGVDVDALRVDDLAGLDQLHAGGPNATEYLLDALALRAGLTLLDVGSGLGGPGRLAALRGCQVTGVDLSADFVTLARTLTERLRLSGQAAFEVGSATALPYGDASFDRAMLIHVGMNIPDKAHVFGEVRRVLKDDGLFAVYEQMRVGKGELRFPMPWASDESASFVETRQRYAELLHAAGFRVEIDEDRTAAVAAGGPPTEAVLTPGVVFGPGFEERITNNIAATMNGILAPILMIARAA